jgi:hypothetical protein
MLARRFTHARRCRAKAGDILRRGDTRLHLSLATILCVTLIFGIVYLANCAFCIIPWADIRAESIILYFLYDIAVGLFQVLVVTFFGLPLIFGTAMVFIGSALDEPRPLSVMLCAYSGPRAYFRSLGIMLRLIILPVSLFGISLLLVLAARLVSDILIVSSLFFLAALCLLGALLYGANDAVLWQAFLHPEQRVRHLFRASHAITRGRRLSQLRFRLSYVGWGLLAIPTLGLSLILHTVPHFTLAYTLFLCEDSEKILDSV